MSSVGGMRKGIEKIERRERKEEEKRKKKKGKGEEGRSSFYWSPVFEQQEV